MLPLLYSLPTNEREWIEWGAVHQSDHLDIAQEIHEKLKQLVAVRPIDPIPLAGNMLAWAMDHQATHAEMNAILKTGGSDLTSVDFRNRDQLLIWIQLHAQEHYAASSTLASLQKK